MADTRRLLAALQTILADNTSALVSPQDVRDLTVSVYPHVENIENHGAVSGGTDETVEIQAAIDKVATAGGGVVLIPVGIWGFTQLKMKTKVHLVGLGWGSELRQLVFAGDAVVLDNSSVEFTRLINFRINGQKALQAGANIGINYDNVGGTFEFGDASHLIENVLVKDTKGIGVTLSAISRESLLKRVVVNNADGLGFDMLASDSVLLHCTAGSCDDHGFQCRSTNTRYIGCKSFGSFGGGSADGFFINAVDRQSFIGCESQDNARHGFTIFNAKDCLFVGCNAGSNGVTFGNGFRLDGATFCQVIGAQAYNRAGTTPQNFGYDITGISNNNMIIGGARSHDQGDFTGPQGQNEVIINGKRPLVTTANLEAAAAVMDGMLVIEDGGAGNRNIIIYGESQRFRIDGGANV